MSENEQTPEQRELERAKGRVEDLLRKLDEAAQAKADAETARQAALNRLLTAEVRVEAAQVRAESWRPGDGMRAKAVRKTDRAYNAVLRKQSNRLNRRQAALDQAEGNLRDAKTRKGAANAELGAAADALNALLAS